MHVMQERQVTKNTRGCFKRLAWERLELGTGNSFSLYF